VGDYRVLYLVDAKLKRIVIGSIGHRREVYRN
jgi:mRNA-degrading endonuclease RelE of RelBE toxin-antitoxin system